MRLDRVKPDNHQKGLRNMVENLPTLDEQFYDLTQQLKAHQEAMVTLGAERRRLVVLASKEEGANRVSLATRFGLHPTRIDQMLEKAE